MIILRQKEFGKTDRELAKALGYETTPEGLREFRKDRASGNVRAEGSIKLQNPITDKHGITTRYQNVHMENNSNSNSLDARISRRGKTTASGGAAVFKAGYNESSDFETKLRDQKLKNAEKTKPNPTPQPKSTPNPTSNSTINKTQAATNKVQEKAGGFIKKAWNGEVGKLGKTGNRALMVATPILAAGGTALALRKKREK